MFVGQRTESLRQRDGREELIHRARSCRHGWFTLEKETETATSLSGERMEDWVKLWRARRKKIMKAHDGCSLMSQYSRRRDLQWKWQRGGVSWRNMRKARTGCCRESERGFSWDEWKNSESYIERIDNGNNCPGWELVRHGEWKHMVSYWEHTWNGSWLELGMRQIKAYGDYGRVIDLEVRK